MNQISVYLLTIPAVLLTIMLHELAHGYTAYRLGDPTAKRLGRLSLNPLKHIDIVGAICMVLFRFGWAKPVPIDPRNFRDPKNGMAITALAGPVTNLLVAFLTVPLYLLAYKAFFSYAIANGTAAFASRLLLMLYRFLFYFHSVNLGLCVFNLIPLPPLDGSRILFAFLPPRYYFAIMRYERYIALGLMLFLLLGARLGFLNVIASAISNGMEAIWTKIPFLR